MSTPTNQDPVVDNGQVLQSTPTVEPTSQTPTGQSPVSANPQAEDIEALRAQAAEAARLRQELDQTQSNYKHLHSEFTRRSQALAELSGAKQQPQHDPYAGIIQKAQSKGYNPEDARFMAEMVHELVQPIQQQQQQYFGALQASQQIGDIMRESWQKDPQLFANPQVAQHVEGMLRQNALSGQPISPELAQNLAVLAQYNLNRQTPQAQPQQTYTPNPQPSFHSFSGPPGGFQPPQQRQQAPVNPLVSQFDEKIKAAWGFPKTA